MDNEDFELRLDAIEADVELLRLDRDERNEFNEQVEALFRLRKEQYEEFRRLRAQQREDDNATLARWTAAADRDRKQQAELQEAQASLRELLDEQRQRHREWVRDRKELDARIQQVHDAIKALRDEGEQ